MQKEKQKDEQKKGQQEKQQEGEQEKQQEGQRTQRPPCLICNSMVMINFLL
jgi:hypothetical protein